MKTCSYCKFSKVQLADDKSDIDFEKPWVCTHDLQIPSGTYLIAERYVNKEVVGYEVHPDTPSCPHFIKGEI